MSGLMHRSNDQPYSITSSARTRIDGGIVKPICITDAIVIAEAAGALEAAARTAVARRQPSKARIGGLLAECAGANGTI
jgi:hypothetical protein